MHDRAGSEYMFSTPMKTSEARARRNDPWSEEEMASLAVFTTLHSSRVLGRRDREESRMWDLAANEVGRTAYECKQRAQLLAPVQPEGYMGEYWRHATSRNDTGSIETEASTKRVSNAAIQDALKRLLGPYMKPGLTLAANKRWAREGLKAFSADDDGRTIRYISPNLSIYITTALFSVFLSYS